MPKKTKRSTKKSQSAKKKSTQKKEFNYLKWILIALLVVVVVFVVLPIVGAIALGILFTVNPSESIRKAETAVTLSQGFSTIENEEYTFYYPAAFEEGPPNNKTTLMTFINPDTRGVQSESISIAEDVLTNTLGTATYDSCVAVAERAYRTKASDTIEVELAQVAPGSENTGCLTKAVMPIDGVDDAAVLYEKALWKKDGSSNKIYRSTAVYFDSMADLEGAMLEEAVDLFERK